MGLSTHACHSHVTLPAPSICDNIAANFIYNKARNYLSVESTDLITFIYINSKVLHRLDVQKGSKVVESAWADCWETAATE